MTPPFPQPSPRRSVMTWTAVALLVAYWVLAISASPRMGVTADEILRILNRREALRGRPGVRDGA